MSKEIKQPINHKNLQGKIYTLIRLSPRKHTLQLQLPRHAGQTLSISSTGMSEYLRNEVSPHQFGMRRGKKKKKQILSIQDSVSPSCNAAITVSSSPTFKAPNHSVSIITTTLMARLLTIIIRRLRASTRRLLKKAELNQNNI